MDLNDKEFLKSLKVLRIITRRFFRDQAMGVRRSLQKGSSLEFSDYREYNPGDDLRFIDWNLYARLDKLFVRLFHDEQNLSVYILLDGSESMRFGSPSKFDYARKVAAAISYIACNNEDSVRIFTFGGDGIRKESQRAARGSQIPQVFRFLEQQDAKGNSALAKAVDEFCLKVKSAGVVFVLSDFFLDGPHEEALRKLRYRRHEVNMIHLLDEEELRPSMVGLWKLEDAETQEVEEVFVDRTLAEAYSELVDDWCQELEGFGRKHGMTYYRTSTQAPFENLLLRFFGAR